MKKIALLRCNANQAGTVHKLHFQPKNPAWAKLAFKAAFVAPLKVIKKTALLRCTANQAGTGHKLHFHPKNPVRAKLAAINNKNGCGTAEV